MRRSHAPGSHDGMGRAQSALDRQLRSDGCQGVASEGFVRVPDNDVVARTIRVAKETGYDRA
jgi:hypothetical protein